MDTGILTGIIIYVNVFQNIFLFSFFWLQWFWYICQVRGFCGPISETQNYFQLIHKWESNGHKVVEIFMKY